VRKRQEQKKTQTNKVKEMVVVTMTSLVQTLNDNRRSQFDGAEEGGEDKISEFLTQNYHGI
jgi:hypothetical protein